MKWQFTTATVLAFTLLAPAALAAEAHDHAKLRAVEQTPEWQKLTSLTGAWTGNVIMESKTLDATGAVLELAADANFARAHCLMWRVPGATLDLADVPSIGKANYFLVRAKADTSRLGAWGSVLRDAARLISP